MELGNKLSDLLKNSKIYLIATFLTGATGLVYQVLWQRYLQNLLGSEARSTTIIVALFLLGLASGYYFWGRYSERISDRGKLLRHYGVIEFFIGVLGALFPFAFKLITDIYLLLPDLLLFDILTCLVLIFPPTFLMGATIPLLTKILPEKAEDINFMHAKIYGLNTLGAFIGVLAGAFYLIFSYGLLNCSLIVGSINIILSFLFYFNGLKGSVNSKDELTDITHPFGEEFIYLLVFITGMVTISLEILWIRVWALTIGSSFVVFPMVLAIFVLGLGYGSLTLKKITSYKLFKELILATLFLSFGILVIPLLPVWLSHLRISFSNIESNYYVFHFFSFLFLMVFLLPLVISLGRILPIGYSLLKKNKLNYGIKCGNIYFLNTLGTFFGAILLSYVMFYFLNLESIFKINLILLGGLLFWVFQKIYGKAKASSVPILIIILILYPWVRDSHIVGLFKQKRPAEYHFKHLLKVPSLSKTFNFKNYYLKDGPNSTVSANEEFEGLGKFIAINGKSDSSTLGDYATVNMLGLAPYFYTKGSNLNTAVVGLGTGVTAGVISALDDVERVDAVEISSAVIAAQKYFHPENYDLLNNKKVKIWEMDAFKFFRNKKDRYDLIVSEPTNPWTVGVENLFTKRFYRSIGLSLKRNGVFSQWFHFYAMDNKLFSSVLSNLRSVFKNLLVIPINGMDVIILASNGSLVDDKEFYLKYSKATPQLVLKKIFMSDPKSFKTLLSFNEGDADIYITSNPSREHSVNFPIAGIMAYRSFFLGHFLEMKNLLNPFTKRLLNSGPIRRSRDWEKWARLKKIRNPNFCKSSKIGQIINSSFCVKFNLLEKSWGKYKSSDDMTRLEGYSFLRSENYLDIQIEMLNEIKIKLLKLNLKLATNRDKINFLLKEALKDGLFEFVDLLLEELRQGQRISIKEFDNLKNFLDVQRNNYYSIKNELELKNSKIVSPSVLFN